MVRAPLTDRLLNALPGPYWLWVLFWALIVPFRPLVNGLALDYTGSPTLARELFERAPAHLFLSLIVALCLLGSHLLWRRAQTATAAVARMDRTGAAPETFSGMGSSAGPLALTAAFTLISEASNVGRYPLVLPVIDTPMLLVVALPIAGFVWSYAAVLVAVDRLGRRTLELEPFPADRSLGLRSIGSLVFAGFAILAVGGFLYIVFLGHFITDIILGAGVFAFGAAAFVLSMWRIHNQMVATKKGHVERARAMYVAAYGPLRNDQSVEVLEQRSRMISAADSIEKRAEAIHEWPVDDRTVARLAIIITGVITGLVVRGMGEILGF